MRVLIDTDPGLGATFADVDDGLTIFLMLNNPEFEIEGITTVYGNTPVKKGFKLLNNYLNLANRLDLPNFLGARSKDALGNLNDASRFLIEKVKENPNELILLTLGPLTNIGTALAHYPEFLDDLKKIVIMGGVLKFINPFSKSKSVISEQFDKSEFNFKNDPIATKNVIECNTQTSRIDMGLDICSKAVFKDEHFKKIESINKPIPQFIAKNIKSWLNFWKKYSDKDGFFPFDLFVPIYLLKPELFKVESYFLSVDTVNYPRMISIMEEKRENSAPITYCTDFADSKGEEEFMEILISNLIK